MFVENVMLPPPKLESMADAEVRVIGLVPEKLMLAFAGDALVVVMELPSSTLPDPFCVKLPLDVITLPGDAVHVPPLVIEIGPLFVVVIFCKNVKAEPVRLIPGVPFVVKLP